ncbi:MAG: VOC family protein [Actinomycetota bacterium]
MEVASYEHGVPSWVDHSSDDPAKAAEFYASFFGWQVQTGPPEAGGYAMGQKGGRNVAGIGPKQGPGPAVWATYVNVDSADDVAARVAEGGGRVLVAPMDVMDAGRMAVFADPAGAVFGVWQPGSMKGAQLVNEEGTFGWPELITTDVEGAKVFYGDVLGWGAKTHGTDGPGAYTEWQVAGRSIGGMMAKPEGMPAEVPPFWGIYFLVADADAAVVRALELGGSVRMPARSIPQGRFATLSDPTGAVFSVIAMSAPGAELGASTPV